MAHKRLAELLNQMEAVTDLADITTPPQRNANNQPNKPMKHYLNLALYSVRPTNNPLTFAEIFTPEWKAENDEAIRLADAYFASLTKEERALQDAAEAEIDRCYGDYIDDAEDPVETARNEAEDARKEAERARKTADEASRGAEAYPSVAAVGSPETTAAILYVARQKRDDHPDGTFDDAKRWYPTGRDAEVMEAGLRSPSRAWPFSYMHACRSLGHCIRHAGAQDEELVRAIVLLLSGKAGAKSIVWKRIKKAVARDRRYVLLLALQPVDDANRR